MNKNEHRPSHGYASREGSGPLAVGHRLQNAQVQHHKAPQLKQLVVHSRPVAVRDLYHPNLRSRFPGNLAILDEHRLSWQSTPSQEVSIVVQPTPE